MDGLEDKLGGTDRPCQGRMRVGLSTPLHRDPFDRLLAAQALDGALVLVSSDPAFRLFSGVELLS